MGDRKISLGKLWITTAGEGDRCEFQSRTTWHQINIELPEGFEDQLPDESRWSIITEYGETFEP